MKINKTNLIFFLIIVISILTICSGKSLKNNSYALESNTKEKNNLLEESNKLHKGYYTNQAILLLESSKYNTDKQIKSKIEEYKIYKDNLVKYNGNIEHIFFHSLIVYPKLAFDEKGHSAEGYNMWYMTTNEFKSILPLLKDRGFVLVNMDDIFTLDSNRTTIRKDLYLPKGKKPLIISQDDVNYYKFMEPDGFTEKLVLDKNNEVASLVKNATTNNYDVTRDGDLIPILDDYIKSNPEFSYQGAKGILAVTGYEGVFGYDIEYNPNIENATKIANKLKENGWEIASHSYTHNNKDFFENNPIHDKLVYDFDKWDKKIKPIIGDTNIFISPYGVTLKGENFKLAKEHGFNIYCNVDRNSTTSIIDNTVIMPRFNIDGFTMNKCKDDINKRFFEVDMVIDGNRPNFN